MKNTENGLYLVYPLLLDKNQSNRISNGKPLYYSSYGNAVCVIEEFSKHYPYLYTNTDSNDQVYCLVIEHYAMDTSFRYQLATWVFSADGKLLCDCVIPDDGPFLGRQKNKICHELGEIVEIPSGNQLFYGIVLEQPLCFNEEAGKYGLTASDDCYAVIRYPENEIYYAHTPLVFKPTFTIPEPVRNNLISAYQEINQ